MHSNTLLLAIVVAILGYKCWVGVHRQPRAEVVAPQPTLQ